MNEGRGTNRLLIGLLILAVLVALFLLAGGIKLPSIDLSGGTNTTGGNTVFDTGTPAPGTGNNTTGNTNIVGGSAQNACVANPALQIEPLRENGQVVPNAFMGLDLNRTEVDSGLRYVVTLPADTYAQYFEAWTGLTYEAVGPTQVTATAWTAWCNNAGWLNSVGFNQYAGKHRVLNANDLPNPIGDWISR